MAGFGAGRDVLPRPSRRRLAPKATATWSARITTGTQTAATTEPIQIGRYPYKPATGVAVGVLNSNGAAAWSGPVLTTSESIDGIASAHLTVTPATANATIFGYLYDVDAAGTGTLITSAPYTLAGVTPGSPQAIDLSLRPISWTVNSGHHVVFVVDTVDRRFTALGGLGQPLVLSSPAADPARLTVPIAYDRAAVLGQGADERAVLRPGQLAVAQHGRELPLRPLRDGSRIENDPQRVA